MLTIMLDLVEGTNSSVLIIAGIRKLSRIFLTTKDGRCQNVAYADRKGFCAMTKRKHAAPANSYLTPAEMSKLMKVSLRTLARWRKESVGPVWVRHGGVIRYVGPTQ